MAKICSAKLEKYKDYKNKMIFFSQNNILENALIQLPLCHTHTHVFDVFEEEEEEEEED